MFFNKKNKIKFKTVIATFVLIVFLCIVVLGIVIYFFPGINNVVIKKTVQIIPFPLVLVDREFISVKETVNNLDSVKKFYESQDFSQLGLRVDFSTEDGENRLKIKEKGVLQKLIDNLIIETEAKKRNINITSDIIDQEVDRKLKEYGTGDYLKENLQKLYGWDTVDFKENIVKSDLYREKLTEDIRKNDQSYVLTRKKMEEVEKKLKAGGDFSVLAKEYSSGESAKEGGKLGWFSVNQMLPEVAKVAFSLDKDKQSDIIESSIGYHIIKVEDKKVENEINMVRLSQIFVRAESFSEWLQKIEKNHKIIILSREFFWNKEESSVEFKNEEMKKYENDLFQNPINDPSIIF